MADVYATLRNNNMPAICFKPTVCKGSISLSSVEYLDLTDAAPDLVLCHNACTPKSNFPSYGTRCTVFVLLSLSNDSFGLAHLPVIVVSAVRFNREKLLHALSELLNTTIKETAYLESCVLTSIETDHSAINISRVIDHSDEFDDEQVAVVFPPLAVGDLASVDKSVSGTVFTTQVSISRLSCVNNIYCYTCHNTEISSVLEEFSCLRVIPL
ncbi:hypothetical protein ADEAN_000659200 [Angomonas deanei]|uniref:Uncharacterized protein n=1 Tax=Angomonas deanei TaxID=59799 RepID=A0A7G2CI62_9TRYP|nr:hypothetical protein ADEAN_000659200 [Angomonas deanei]